MVDEEYSSITPMIITIASYIVYIQSSLPARLCKVVFPIIIISLLQLTLPVALIRSLKHYFAHGSSLFCREFIGSWVMNSKSIVKLYCTLRGST